MLTPEEIIQARETRSWNQHALANYVGVDQATVSRWERGKAKPRGAALRLLHMLLDQREAAE